MKFIGWLMLVLGIIMVLILISGIQQGALQKPGGQSVVMPVLIFGLANAVLGFGVIKSQKWGA
ncbi:MAG: hypothetical protein KJ710_02450 [Candidatus Omnitrophica bacterium]|nr:hypothetical protein [Candidatus Omnitrophota bacterium]MBU1923107.1 hypothetical protein [Candidatus Omnitrophota bacterium]